MVISAINILYIKLLDGILKIDIPSKIRKTHSIETQNRETVLHKVAVVGAKVAF